MKKFLCLLICFLLMFSVAACAMDGGDEQVSRGYVFEAEVKEVNEESILVMPTPDSSESKAAMNVGLVVIKTENMPAVKVGDRVRIDYDGVITRSIPGQLGEVYKFEVLG